MIFHNSDSDLLGAPLTLPCGAVLKNRLVKSAMSDALGDGAGNPTQTQIQLYQRWAQSGVALSIIGEVQVDPAFPEKPGNLVLDARSNLTALSLLATKASVTGAHIWPQLGHAGALSHLPISCPSGPSPLQLDNFCCGGMTLAAVKKLPHTYAQAAAIAKQVGFTGVQIHAGHGFLLSQFLSPLFNHRNDQYGGSITARAKLIIEVIAAIRSTVGPAFPIGIKINSSDQLAGGLIEQDALAVIGMLDKSSIDLIEISGGTYFPAAQASSERTADGPYFVDFCLAAQPLTKVPLVATGGFKTKLQAQNARASGAVEMVGLARAFVLNPQLANDWISQQSQDPDFPQFAASPAGGITAWYTMMLTALANETEHKSLDLHTAHDQYQQRDSLRCEQWREQFSPWLSDKDKNNGLNH